MARFPKYNYLSGEPFNAHVELCWYRNETPSTLTLHWELSTEDGTHSEGTVETGVPADANYIDICDLKIDLPAAERMTKAALSLQIEGTNIRKGYDLWIYPETSGNYLDGIRIFEKLTDEVIGLLEQGENVLLMPKPEALNNVVEGYYCTDFWCYPMFRSISESMNREVPIGTMGLLIDNTHPVFRDFPCEPYSTYPWWSIIENSKSIIMDETDLEWSPIVQTIDNFERNHKLGFLFECQVGSGNLMICALDAGTAGETLEGRQFLSSLTNYMLSEEFKPKYQASAAELLRIIQ